MRTRPTPETLRPWGELCERWGVATARKPEKVGWALAAVWFLQRSLCAEGQVLHTLPPATSAQDVVATRSTAQEKSPTCSERPLSCHDVSHPPLWCSLFEAPEIPGVQRSPLQRDLLVHELACGARTLLVVSGCRAEWRTMVTK